MPPDPTGFSLSWLSSLMAPFKWFLGAMQERTPLKVHGHIGHHPPSVLITIINKTKSVPLEISEVRIHFGIDNYSYYFKLASDGGSAVAPKARCDFHLPFKATIVGRRTESNEPPKISQDSAGPGFDSPADLFKAIARNERKMTWLEIDFNEFTKRKFLVGEIQPLFDAIIKMGPPKTIDSVGSD